MRQIIYIATTPGRLDILQNCLASLKAYDGKYPICIESWYQYDWFDFALHNDFDELLFLHDSIEVKDYSIFDLVFESHRGESVSFTGLPFFVMGLGKFLRKPYLASVFPNKNAYMDYGVGEYTFGPTYVKNDGGKEPFVLFPDFMDEEQRQHGKVPHFERKFGRQNMIMENKYIKKYKAHWTYNMLKNVDKNGYQIGAM